jgi:hypothetical protein
LFVERASAQKPDEQRETQHEGSERYQDSAADAIPHTAKSGITKHRARDKHEERRRRPRFND